MDKLAERSTQPLTRCWQTGREDSAEDNETCSRPPTDLRGSPCGMRQPFTGSGAVGLCSRSHRRSGILPVPGMRGKYGTQRSYREPSNRAFLSYGQPKPFRRGGSLFCGLKWKTTVPLLLVIVARGGARSKDGTFVPPFHVSPRTTGNHQIYSHR